ncbi:MAG: chalcone isomerase family protein [Burkholderiales bacterium]|nr:chalcone isomerase family protein [Burkholderiales bacterium]MDE2076935.1 chalcone isomerase family protein [Burkholderiales bacterium]MDE2433360.1 chalcone isomerase family protein [Burkholderiales bacterium]
MRPARPLYLSRRQALLAWTVMSTLPTQAMTTASIAPLHTPPAEVASSLRSARLVGQGNLRFFGLLVYEARLWAAPAFESSQYDSQPFALELQYARKLDGPDIAERSIAEMRRVGDFTEAQSKVWLALMLQAFPNVGAQDRLTGVYDGRGRVRFFFNGKQTAEIQDKDYARLFFGIWLSPKTSAPALRSALVGQA